MSWWRLLLGSATMLFLELALIALTQRFRPRPTIAVGTLLIGMGFALTGFAHSIPLLALTVLVWSLGEMVAVPMSSAFVANLAPVHMRGRYSGAWATTARTGAGRWGAIHRATSPLNSAASRRPRLASGP